MIFMAEHKENERLESSPISCVAGSVSTGALATPREASIFHVINPTRATAPEWLPRHGRLGSRLGHSSTIGTRSSTPFKR